MERVARKSAVDITGAVGAGGVWAPTWATARRAKRAVSSRTRDQRLAARFISESSMLFFES